MGPIPRWHFTRNLKSGLQLILCAGLAWTCRDGNDRHFLPEADVESITPRTGEPGCGAREPPGPGRAGPAGAEHPLQSTSCGAGAAGRQPR